MVRPIWKTISKSSTLLRDNDNDVVIHDSTSSKQTEEFVEIKTKVEEVEVDDDEEEEDDDDDEEDEEEEEEDKTVKGESERVSIDNPVSMDNPVSKEKLRSIMAAASALTALGEEEESTEVQKSRSNSKSIHLETNDRTDAEARRFIPGHKKPDSALTFPEKVSCKQDLIVFT
jgi:hypothetical protein